MTIANRKSGNRKCAPDARHHRLMVELDRMYRAYNDGLPLPNPGRVAKRLSNFLKANPSWPLERLRRAVWNRYYSIGVNRAEDPALWLGKLANYAADPLNKWGSPIRGKSDEVAEYWEQNPLVPEREDGKAWDTL